MNKIFDIDSPAMRFLTKVADLMILNILVIICSLPIITIGASMTGLHYVLLKMVRNEDGYIARAFFKSFKENFKQATLVWLVILIFLFIFVGDLLIFNYSGIEFPNALKIVLFALVIFVSMIIAYVFPVLSRFENTVWNTMKNAMFMSILSFPKTVLMLIMYAVPVAVAYFLPIGIPLVFMFGISVPSYLSAMLYSGTFKKFEPEEEAVVDRFETSNDSDLTEN